MKTPKIMSRKVKIHATRVPNSEGRFNPAVVVGGMMVWVGDNESFSSEESAVDAAETTLGWAINKLIRDHHVEIGLEAARDDF